MFKSQDKNRIRDKTQNKFKSFVKLCEFIVLGIFLAIGTTAGSVVVDKTDQNTLKFSDYCPKIGSCVAGSHILCNYFNPNSRFGVSCVDPENIKMTPSLATHILQVLNAMRARLAQGIEVGKEKLPRAYGLLRLQWDKELATFAQLWADKCLQHRGYCRATKKFYNVDVVLLEQKSNYPNWTSVISSKNKGLPGLTHEKIYSFIISGLRHIFSKKNSLTAAEVYRTGVRQTDYQRVVNSDVSHIGCGISGFTKFLSWDRDSIVKNFEIVCHVSARLIAGKPLYRTTPPRPIDTQKCGCEPGYLEDDDCLCYEDDIKELCSENNEKCKPPVVLLPIVTFEDMPQKKVNRSNDHHSSSIERRFRGLSTLTPRQSQNLITSTNFDASKNPLMKIKISSIKELTGVHGTLNNYLEKIRNEEGNEHYSFSPKPIIPDYTISDYIKTKLGNHNITGHKPSLVSLLDKVEDEIYSSQLSSDTMQTIEDKIKKIYGTVLGKKYNYLINNKVNGQVNNNKIDERNKVDKYNLLTNQNIPKTYTQDIMDLQNFGSVKAIGNNFESIGDVVHRVKNIIEDISKVKTIETSTQAIHLNPLDEDDVLSADRKKYYEDILNNLKRSKDYTKKSLFTGRDYILERPVQRLRPSFMEKELRFYPVDIYNSMDSDFLY